MTIHPGKNNLITDIPGIRVGNATDENVASGVTVVRFTSSFSAAVDIRGGAPGTRETDVLASENLVRHVDAIVLTGGSVFGLGAADGVTSYLSGQNIGLRLSEKSPAIPIVSAAVLHDLGNEGDKNWGDTPPYHRLGIEAISNADTHFQLGAVGAGRGAKAGVLKGGLGSCSAMLDDGILVGALAAVNPLGSVVMPDGETFYAAPFALAGELGAMPTQFTADTAHPFPPHARLGGPPPAARENTTLVVVATNAALSHIDLKRISIMAHDGFARAIRPAHTPYDGDIVFAVTSGDHAVSDDPQLRSRTTALIGSCAADCVARAIARGVYAARL